jgi:hypothetical protein
MKRLAQEHQNALDKIEKQREESEKLAKYEYDLTHPPLGEVAGGGSGGSGGSGGTKTTTVTSSSGKVHSGGGGKFGQTTTTSNTSSNPPVNMKSVLALGYGSISTTKLNKLVQSGEVLTYVQNGQRYFKKNPMYHKTKYSFGK